MSGERSYAILPVPDLEGALSFYSALGFDITFRQLRPNPYAVVRREDLQIHLAGVDGFDPESSMGSVIVTVADADRWYESFRNGLEQLYGRTPSRAIPRLLRPRRKAGTATGFSVVDVGGNWIRVFREQQLDERPDEPVSGLARVLEVAARQGDARGDEGRAVAVLTAGLTRYADAAPALRLEALAYRAELLHRLGRAEEAEQDALAAERMAQPGDAGPDSLATLEHLRRVLAHGR